MGLIIKKQGYNYVFDQKACEKCDGNCCIGESGYIWVSPQEIEEISNSLSISKEEFKISYLVKIGYKFSIKEVLCEKGFKCVFFDLKNKKCTIYQTRPTQCRTFPFWDYFKIHQEEAEKECPGILPLL